MTSNIIDVISLIASIVSFILAVFAIWLSFKFLKLSSEISDKINTALGNIMKSVDKLDLVYNKLYSDTFSIMKDTITDMRKNLWENNPDEVDIELEEKMNERIDALKRELTGELSTLLTEQNKTINNNKINELESTFFLC